MTKFSVSSSIVLARCDIPGSAAPLYAKINKRSYSPGLRAQEPGLVSCELLGRLTELLAGQSPASEPLRDDTDARPVARACSASATLRREPSNMLLFRDWRGGLTAKLT